MPRRRRAGIMMVLHGYWRSTASYRVRIALNLKNIAVETAAYDLRSGAQHQPRYAAVNPQQLVPALETDLGVLTQSLAILEWLEERYPAPALLPNDHFDRAIIRAMAATVACDVHPLNNLRVLNALRNDLGLREERVKSWIANWLGQGLAALEIQIGRFGGRFAFGDSITMADCFIVPQVYSAERFDVELTRYPRLMSAADAARRLPAFAAAHPDMQYDADAI